MARRLSITPIVVAAAALSLAPTLAHAGPKDAIAKRLDDAAMNDDFLAVKFGKAEEKLRRAIRECSGKRCDAKLEAQIHVHLGIILVNAGKNDAAVQSFVDALKIKPSVTPDKDFVTPEIEKAFQTAQGRAGGKPNKVAPPRDDDAPVTDMQHTPVTESETDAPIPIFILVTDPTAASAVVHYKPPKGDWKRARMKKKRKGWGALIPCKDTTASGPLAYYITAHDADGDPVARAGTRERPFVVQIKDEIKGEAPSFPDEDPPAKCNEAGECKPGSAGCETEPLAEGASCTSSEQCDKSDGLTCVEGTCQKTETGEENGGPTTPQTFLSLGVSVDVAWISSGQPCSPDAYSTAKYACFRSDGRLYKPTGPSGDGGSGLTPSTVRLLVGLDRVIVGNLALGVRFGIAFRGGPAVPGPRGDRDFFPWHIEPRATYFIGDDVLSRDGFRPYAFLGGGMAQVDTKLPGVAATNDCDLQGLCRSSRTPSSLAYNLDGSVRTHADGTPVYITPDGKDVATLPARPKGSITVDAYRKMGTGFIGVGGGVLYALGKQGGVSLDVKLAYYLGSPGFTVSPTLAGVYAF